MVPGINVVNEQCCPDILFVIGEKSLGPESVQLVEPVTVCR